MQKATIAVLGWIERINVIAGSIAGIGVILFIATIVPDTLTRKFASFSFQGISEFNILTLVVLIFLGQASAQCWKQHFQVRVLLDLLPAGLRRFNLLLVFAVQLAVALVFAWLTSERAITSFEIDESTFSVIAFPVWPSRIVIAIGFWMLSLQLMIDMLRQIRPDWAPPARRSPDDFSEA